jgi:hypothetical protein
MKISKELKKCRQKCEKLFFKSLSKPLRKTLYYGSHIDKMVYSSEDFKITETESELCLWILRKIQKKIIFLNRGNFNTYELFNTKKNKKRKRIEILNCMSYS